MRTLVFCIVWSLLSVGANAKTVKKKASYVKLVEATTQRTLPGIPGAAIRTDTHVIIVWQAATYPTSFFWRGENGWLPCSIARLKTQKGGHGGKSLAEVTNGNIHRGDTLQLTPMPGGKFPVPAEIPTDTKNTLFFKTGSSNWLSFQVNKIKTLPDIVNP